MSIPDLETRISEEMSRMMPNQYAPDYSKNQLILCIGDGNLSFSSSLATTFGDASNIVATTLDSIHELMTKYGTTAMSNIDNLSFRRALVIHEVDARNMFEQFTNDLSLVKRSLFDVIIFNFPHSGFWPGRRDHYENVIQMERELMRLVFANAVRMLLPGGAVHITHKLGFPYYKWKLEEQAQMSGLKLTGLTQFRPEAFPGYQHCYGSGLKAGEKFPLGKAATFKFSRMDAQPVGVLNKKMENEPLRMDSTMMLQVTKLKEEWVRKGRASQETSLVQVPADEITPLREFKLIKKKMAKLTSFESASTVMTLLGGGYSSSSLPRLNCNTVAKSTSPSDKQCFGDYVLPLSKLNLSEENAKVMVQDTNVQWESDKFTPPSDNHVVGDCVPQRVLEYVGEENAKIIRQVTRLKVELVKKGRVSQETSLVKALADEVTRRSKLKHDPKEMENSQSLEYALRFMETLGEENTKIMLQVTNLKADLVRKGRANKEASCMQALADEVTRLGKLNLGPKKMRKLQSLESALRVMKTLGGQRHAKVMLQVTNLKADLVRKGWASQETSLIQVLADEVTRLGKQKLGQKKIKELRSLESALRIMKLSDLGVSSKTLQPLVCNNVDTPTTLPHSQFVEGSREPLPEDLGEDNAKIISMDMALRTRKTSKEIEWVSQSNYDASSTRTSCSEQKVCTRDLFQFNSIESSVSSEEENGIRCQTFTLGIRSGANDSRTFLLVDKVEEKLKDCASKQGSKLQLGGQSSHDVQDEVQMEEVFNGPRSEETERDFPLAGAQMVFSTQMGVSSPWIPNMRSSYPRDKNADMETGSVGCMMSPCHLAAGMYEWLRSIWE